MDKRVITAVKRKFIRKSCSGIFSSFENNASRNGPTKQTSQHFVNIIMAINLQQ